MVMGGEFRAKMLFVEEYGLLHVWLGPWVIVGERELMSKDNQVELGWDKGGFVSLYGAKGIEKSHF